MEEDIKILEEIQSAFKLDETLNRITPRLYIRDSNRYIEAHIIDSAIENLLKRYKELEEENKEIRIIKSAIRTIETNFVNDDTYYVIGKTNFFKGSYKKLLDDYIPISVIQNKIKELEKWEYNDDFEPNLTIQDQLEVLEELLEERNK